MVKPFLKAVPLLVSASVMFTFSEQAIAAKADKAAPAAARRSASYRPLFAPPAGGSPALSVYFVGRDPAVMNGMDFSAQANTSRSAEIQRLSADFKLQQRGSQQAIQLGESILKLYEEQCVYLENLRGFGMSDSRYPDLDHSIKVARSALVAHAEQLLQQSPKAPQGGKWRASALLSRLRIGDPSVVQEAVAFSRNNRSGDGTRVTLTGIAWDISRGQSSSSFGSLEKALDLPMDGASKAAFLLLAAEKAANARSARALDLFQEAGKAASGLRGPDGRANPMMLRAAAKAIDLALATRNDGVDSEVVSFLQGLGLAPAAHYYVERVALNTVDRQPRQAMTFYADILQIGVLPPATLLNIEHRILDIAIGSNDADGTESQWMRITKANGGMQVPGTEGRITATQNLTWTIASRDSTAAAVDRFVRLHDLFTPLAPSYAQNDSWTLKVLEGLFKTRRDASVANRAEALAGSSRSATTQISALRYAARSRERMMNIPQEPDFLRNRRPAGGEELASAYITSLERLSSMVKGQEAETCSYQASYISHVSGQSVPARGKFEAALSKYPKSKFAPKAVSFLLDLSLSSKDHAYTEKIARLAERIKVVPASANHKDLRKIVENAVWEQAGSLANQGQAEAAAQRYVAFQKEFPKAPRADQALDLAAKNYLAARKVDLAIGQMEALLAQYPSSNLAKETRWQAAEQSKGAGQFLRAANHYEAFAKDHAKEGESRKAWYKAAEMHKGIGRFANAIADLEKHLNQMNSKGEKVKASKEIADLHVKYGKSSDGIGALERVMKLSGSVDDEIWARSQMLDIYTRQSQPAMVRQTVNKIMALKPTTQDGFKAVAKAKHHLGRLEADATRELNPMQDRQLYQATNALMARFDKTKSLLLAPCEVPGLEWCSVGYYETSRLAEDVAKTVLEIEPPPTLEPKEAEKTKKLVLQSGEKLAEESRTAAIQAEQALATGAPDGEWAERIRAWAQSQRGETGTPPKVGP